MSRVMCKNFYVSIVFLFLQTQAIIAYQKVDSLPKNNTYQFLADMFYANEADSATAFIYANKYLVKAKSDYDTLRIADGYYFFLSISKRDISLKYSDSIIAITKNRNSEFYPIFAFYNKAKIYYEEGNYKKAFDYFLKVNKEAKKHNNIYLKYKSKKSISILKSRLGEHETALKALKECESYYSKHKEEVPLDYLRTLFALSDAYNLNKKLDSATIINNLGYKESSLLNNENYNFHFTLNEGINQFSKGNYIAAKDSLKKVIRILEVKEDKANLSMAHFYLGKTLSFLQDESRAIKSHKKVDEIFQETSEIMPNNRESYEVLITYYKKANDKDNQLKYIERLIKVDSVLNTNYKYLIKNVIHEYDTSRLIAEKQEIINSLQTDKKSSFLMIIALVLISILLVIFLIFNHQKKKKYKKTFDQLYHSDVSNREKEKKSIADSKIATIGISDQIVNDILRELEIFEKDLAFLKPNITTNDLAKKMKTNSKYLSKVVNHFKKKSFSTYINELRIDYCIERLKTDRKFMLYTVKAIAREIGFNSSDAFSKSFYKIKGIQPSYFIKELEKQQS